MERLGLAIGHGESDAELAVTDDQPRDDWLDEESDDRLADDPWLDDEDEPGPWPDADAALGQATASDAPDAIAESDVAINQVAESLETQRLGDAAAEVAPSDQSETAPSSEQPETITQIDPVQQLLAGDDAELEAAIRQAQAEADAAAQALESWSQRQDDLQQTRERAKERIAELRPKRAELLAEVLLRGNKRAKGELDRLTRDLRELQDIVDVYQQVLLVAAAEGAKLYVEVAHHSTTVRHLQARLKARQLVRQAQAVDQAIVALLGELARAQQLVEELAPLVPDSAGHYLNPFRRGGGDLPIRLSLAYHCRNMGVGGILDLPAYTPQSSRPLAVQIGELLANLLKPTTDNSEVPNAELHRADAGGTAAAAQ
jgi:hypothetical protein